MKIPHDKFCVLPWISLETGPTGTIRPCCLADGEIINDDGEKFDLKSCQFTQVQSSQWMQQLRQDFLDKKQPSVCRRCWDEEDSGRISKRMHTLDRLKNIISDDSWTADAKPLIFLDLKLGNICNLKCRICGSWSSSTFATEEIQFLHPSVDRKSDYNYIMLRRGSWPRENDKFWEEISNISDQIRYLEFTGGEPFMIQEHFDLLRRLVDRGLAGQIEIHYNTNGTQRPSIAEEIWRNFRHVEIAFSIDDLRDRFEYQRSNAVWKEVEENLAWFYELKQRNKNISLQVCSTVSVFNIWYLEELALWHDAQNFDFVYWNMCHDPPHYSIGSLPASVKALIKQRLDSARVSDRTRSEFNRMIDFMFNGVSRDTAAMFNAMKWLDHKRNQNLADAHSEWADILRYDKT